MLNFLGVVVTKDNTFVLRRHMVKYLEILCLKCSGRVQWEDPEGWDGEGGRRGDRDGEHM